MINPCVIGILIAKSSNPVQCLYKTALSTPGPKVQLGILPGFLSAFPLPFSLLLGGYIHRIPRSGPCQAPALPSAPAAVLGIISLPAFGKWKIPLPFSIRIFYVCLHRLHHIAVLPCQLLAGLAVCSLLSLFVACHVDLLRLRSFSVYLLYPAAVLSVKHATQKAAGNPAAPPILFGSKQAVSRIAQARHDIAMLVEPLVDGRHIDVHIWMCLTHCLDAFWRGNHVYQTDIFPATLLINSIAAMALPPVASIGSNTSKSRSATSDGSLQ